MWVEKWINSKKEDERTSVNRLKINRINHERNLVLHTLNKCFTPLIKIETVNKIKRIQLE